MDTVVPGQMSRSTAFSPNPEEAKEKTTRRQPHWTISILFDLATAKGYRLRDLENMILSKHGVRIPADSMKYWRYGHSDPKVGEVEKIADVLGHDLELMDRPTP